MSKFRSLTACALLALVGSIASAPVAVASPAAVSSTPIISQVAMAVQAVRPTGVAQCQLLPDPHFPLELGTAVAGGLFKTVAMEKELFLPGGGRRWPADPRPRDLRGRGADP